MATVFTVHGTFCRPSEGDQWWQAGSQFEKELRESVVPEDGVLHFRPVVWDGHNSERSRRKAANILKKYAGKGTAQEVGAFAVVAHSHGGSVVEHAMHQLVFNRGGNLSRVIAVATPHINFRASGLSFFRRLNLLNKIAFITLIVLIAMYISFSVFYPNAVPRSFDTESASAAAGNFVFAFLLPLALLCTYYLVTNRFFERSSFSQKLLAETEPFRWISLYDRNDEAVYGLMAVTNSLPKIFTPLFAVQTLSTAALFSPPFLVIWLCSSPSAMMMFKEFIEGWPVLIPMRLTNDGQLLMENLVSITNFLWDNSSSRLRSLFGLNTMFVSVYVIALVFYLLFLAAVGLAMLIVRLISRGLSMVFNPLAWGAIRQSTFGSDILGEVAHGSGTVPYWMTDKLSPIPDSLSDEINAFSDAAFAKSVPRMRAIIHDGALFGGIADPETAISKYFTWDELVHTSYFAIPRFRKLIYYIVANSRGFRPTAAFLDDPDYPVVAGWWSEILWDRAQNAIEERRVEIEVERILLWSRQQGNAKEE